ncbi:MAG: acetylxylan esterase [Planctomycetaceae bacterium]|nr:acetylxylan esterase [Planctomycetaceae bacterium]
MKKMLLIFMLVIVSSVQAQPPGFNYDESKVPDYELPQVLRSLEGKRIKTVEWWQGKRRGEILELFREHVYGRVPLDVKAEIIPVIEEQSDEALGGIAIRRQVRLYLQEKGKEPYIDVLIYLPKLQLKRDGAVPIFTGLNFSGNHTVTSEKEVAVHEKWARNDSRLGHSNNQANEGSRGKSVERWQVKMLLKNGFGLATAYYGDIDPDFDDEFNNGVHTLFNSSRQLNGGDWGSIATWAWGLSRMMDYFETDGDIDHQRVALTGLSRLGKTSLWAGAEDQRFAIVISTDSGCGGAALSRRMFGETVKRINTAFPHWFCDNFNNYNDQEERIPVDQHMLIALLAPRPAYIASAEKDVWADPKGEFISGLEANSVYKLFGKQGTVVKHQPAVNVPVGDYIGYHIRSGDHDANEFDWQQYIKFARRHFNMK